MKVTITLEHWNIAKVEDRSHAGMGRVHYCPIAQCLKSMGLSNVSVDGGSTAEYNAHYCGISGVVTGCGVEVAKTFDRELPLPADLLPCTFELPDVPAKESAS